MRWSLVSKLFLIAPTFIGIGLIYYSFLSSRHNIYQPVPHDNFLPAPLASSTFVHPVSSPPSNSTTVSSTNQPATTSAEQQLARFRILTLTFTYHNKAGAVWIDQGHTEDAGPLESYIYRYPYDPEKDSGVNSAGEYVYFKNTVGSDYFSLEIYSNGTDEPIEEYINRNYPDLDLRTATPYRKGKFSGFVISYPASPNSSGGEVFIFQSGHDVFKMTNESQMFTDSEFMQIVSSVTPTVRKGSQ